MKDIYQESADDLSNVYQVMPEVIGLAPLRVKHSTTHVIDVKSVDLDPCVVEEVKAS